jgi:hypothetical protein
MENVLPSNITGSNSLKELAIQFYLYMTILIILQYETKGFKCLLHVLMVLLADNWLLEMQV